MTFLDLLSLSPLDGRYAAKLDALRPHFSEYGLIRRRLQVEIEWLKALAQEPHFAEIPPFSAATLAALDRLLADFSPAQAAEVKDIEKTTNHDVKALEYWIKKQLADNAEVMRVAEFIHFACTSEDINNLSHALMLKAARDEVMLPMFDQVIGTREPDPVPESAERPGIEVHNIALLAEYNICGEFWHVAPLFDELGLRVLGSLSGDARFHEVQTLHRAEASMVVCSNALLNVARQMKERWGVSYFEGSFYGISDTSKALRDFSRLVGDPALAERTEVLIQREEAKANTLLAPWRDRLAGKRALLYTGGVKSWSIISALQDLGMEVVATGVRKSTEEDKARIRELMGDDAHMIEDGNPAGLLKVYNEKSADVLIAGGRNLYTAMKARVPFLDINQEREHAYAGYVGMVEMARQLALTIESPVWPAVRKAAPWARDTSVGVPVAARKAEMLHG